MKLPVDFTQDELAERGWTKEVLEYVAEGYEQVAQITPNNPSALGRAKQLREIIKHFFHS